METITARVNADENGAWLTEAQRATFSDTPQEAIEAQLRVVAVVRRLEDEGKLTLGRGGGGTEDELLE